MVCRPSESVAVGCAEVLFGGGVKQTGRLKVVSDGLLGLYGLFAADAGNFAVVQFDVAPSAAAAGDGYAVGGFPDGQGFFHAHGNGGGGQVFGQLFGQSGRVFLYFDVFRHGGRCGNCGGKGQQNCDFFVHGYVS